MVQVVDIRSRFYQLSFFCWVKPVRFLGRDGFLADLALRIEEDSDALTAGSSKDWTRTLARTDQKNRIRMSRPKVINRGHLDIGTDIRRVITIDERSLPWIPPLSICIATPSLEGQPWSLTWSLSRNVREDLFLDLVQTQVDYALAAPYYIGGIAGYGMSSSSGGLNSPFFLESPDSNSHTFPIRSLLPGVHWINLLHQNLWTSSVSERVRSEGFEVIESDQVVVVKLTPRPSDLTDEIVGRATTAFSQVLDPAALDMRPDWWRRSWGDVTQTF